MLLMCMNINEEIYLSVGFCQPQVSSLNLSEHGVCLETLLMTGAFMLIISACIFLGFNYIRWSCHTVKAGRDLW